VLTPLQVKGPGSNLVVTTAPLAGAFTIDGAIVGAIAFEENLAGRDFGTTWRVGYSGASVDQPTLRVAAGAFADEWGNSNAAQAVTFSPASAVGTVEYNTDTNTAPVRVARSTVGSPFLFHGQYFDYDAGLVYLRARFYDPYTGQFLERDPFGYEDSVNLYAAFGQNPVNFRDPSGTSFLSLFKLLPRAGRAVGRGATGAYRWARNGVLARAQPFEMMTKMDVGWTYQQVKGARRGLSSMADDIAEAERGATAATWFNGSKYELPQSVRKAFYNPESGKAEALLSESLAVAPIRTRANIYLQRGKNFAKNSWYSINPRAEGKWRAIERTMPRPVKGEPGEYLAKDVDVWTDPDAFAKIDAGTLALREEIGRRANDAARFEFVDVRKANHGLLHHIFPDALGKGMHVRTTDLFSNGGYILDTGKASVKAGAGPAKQFVSSREVMRYRR
jgi:RHS repeat-associated protein